MTNSLSKTFIFKVINMQHNSVQIGEFKTKNL